MENTFHIKRCFLPDELESREDRLQLVADFWGVEIRNRASALVFESVDSLGTSFCIRSNAFSTNISILYYWTPDNLYIFALNNNGDSISKVNHGKEYNFSEIFSEEKTSTIQNLKKIGIYLKKMQREAKNLCI